MYICISIYSLICTSIYLLLIYPPTNYNYETKYLFHHIL